MRTARSTLVRGRRRGNVGQTEDGVLHPGQHDRHQSKNEHPGFAPDTRSLLSRRFLPSRAKLRSTIQVKPVILNARCRLLTIRSCHPWCCFRARASLRLSWPASAMTVRILGNNALNPPSSRAPARRSDVSAGSTRLATMRPSVSTKIWRLRPWVRDRKRPCPVDLIRLPSTRISAGPVSLSEAPSKTLPHTSTVALRLEPPQLLSV
jgi:hypothetical protein